MSSKKECKIQKKTSWKTKIAQYMALLKRSTKASGRSTCILMRKEITFVSLGETKIVIFNTTEAWVNRLDHQSLFDGQLIGYTKVICHI